MDRRVISVVSAIGFALGAAGCGSKRDVEGAKHSLYDTDFAVVYSAALEATRELYPNLDDAPGRGRISTSWHQVTYASNQDDLANQQTVASANGMGQNSAAASSQGNPGAVQAGMPTRLAYKRYFIRFDVSIAGGRPWRVKVIGHASEWEPGAALPTELHGPARPSWLEPRTEALQVSIYKRIKNFAIPMKEDTGETEEAVAKTDPSMFKSVPPGAAKRLASIKDSLAKRDYVGLRPQLADDLTWRTGEPPDANTALTVWNADSEAFDTMAKLVTGDSCVADGDKRVKCPAEQAPGTYQLVVELRGDAWKVTSFVKAE
jgi:hypothetical protein